MAYTPQSPDEQSYIADLNKHDQAIWDYHKAKNVPLEDAYQAVTGKPWMAGRSIKFVGGTKGNTGNGFDMTKDRTFKSILGKYVAPIGGGVLAALTAGGALPALSGLFGGGGGAAAGGTGAAATGGGMVGGGLGGALGGSAGLIPTVGAVGSGFGPGALAAGATIPGAGMVSGVGGGASLLGTLGKIGTLGRGTGDTDGQGSSLGDVLSQGAGANAAGRREDAAANMQAAPFNLNAPNVRAQQVARGDVLQNLQPYTGSGSGKDFHISGGLSPSLFGPDTRQAGDALKKQALTALLNKSDQIKPSHAGLGENVMAGAGLGLNILGGLGKMGRFF